MLLEPDGSPAWRSEDVLRALPTELAEHTRGETHGLALELATNPHETVAAAANELRGMRAGLAETVRALGLRAAVAGTHPTVRAEEVEVSPGARYQYLHASLRELARREPTFALHVHVAVPDAELAVRALNGMRAHIPVLLALSANSPFTRGTDSGLASARTPVFQAFPRTGIPRAMDDYADYVEAIDVLIRCGAIPEPTFIWWDVRLQPRFGTLEVRVMDAQTRIRDTAALAALVQCLVRLEALDEPDLSLAPRGDRREPLPGRARRHPRAAARSRPRPLRAGRRTAGDARRRLLAARPRARLRARAGAARAPGRRPRSGPPARDRLRARGPRRPPAHAPVRVLPAAPAAGARRLAESRPGCPGPAGRFPPPRAGSPRRRAGDPACAAAPFLGGVCPATGRSHRPAVETDRASWPIAIRPASLLLLALAAGCGGGDGGPAAPRPCPSALTGEPERRPPRELALPAGAHVYASEGPFGKTERFFAVVAGRPEDLLTPRDTAADALVAGGFKLLTKDAEPPIEAEAHLTLDERLVSVQVRACARASCGCATRSLRRCSRQRRTTRYCAKPSARQARKPSSIIALA